MYILNILLELADDNDNKKDNKVSGEKFWQILINNRSSQ